MREVCLRNPLFREQSYSSKSLVAGSTTEKDGFFVISYRHTPCQIHYIGPHKPSPVTVHRKEYTARYSYCTAFVTDAEACVVGLAAQQTSNILIAEAPFSRAFSDTGCALWRLAQCAAAKADWLQTQGCINHCHRELERLPLVLIEGYFENCRLSVCLSTAKALCAQEQADVWTAHGPSNL